MALACNRSLEWKKDKVYVAPITVLASLKDANCLPQLSVHFLPLL